jgi:hypothetical protein
MSENVQRDGAEITKKKTLISRGEKKKEEIPSRNCHPHHTTASRFINTAKQALLHMLSILSRYYATSESVQRDDHRSSFHDMLHFRYDEHRPSLHVEGLFSVSEPVGLPRVPWTEKTIERSPFFVLSGGHCFRGDLVGRTNFLFLFSGLQKLEQRTEKCIELRGEYVE